jgi:uncharacterized damage-inducible protein DinB
MMIAAPDQSEYAAYYRTYIDQVPAGDICDVLDTQTATLMAMLRGISDEQSLYRYAADKWSIRQVVNHISDTERVFVFRGFWFARGFDAPLPAFDQDVAVAQANADQHSWASHVAEFEAVRAATMAFWRSVPDEAWSRRGMASGNPFTVRALAWITAGHAAHHIRILRDSYLT